MIWSQALEQLSSATASPLQPTDADVLVSLGTLGLVVASFWIHAFVFKDVEPPRYERVENAGAGFVMRRGLMQAGYWALQPTGELLVRFGVSANCVTVAGLLFSSVAATAIVYGRLGFAGLALLSSALCDVLDGMVARLGRGSSESGAVLDSMLDRLSEIVVLAAFAIAGRQSSIMVTTCLSALLASLMNSYVSAKAEVYRVSIPNGRMRRGERFAWTILGSLLVPLAQAIAPLFQVKYAAVPLVACIAIVALGAASSAFSRAIALCLALNSRAKSGSRVNFRRYGG